MSNPHYFIVEVRGAPMIFDFIITDSGMPVQIKCRYFDLPPAARRLTHGDQAIALERNLRLFQDLLAFALPLWQYGLSTPDYYPRDIVRSPRDLAATKPEPTDHEWVTTIRRTFAHHAVHWYHVAHVLTAVLAELSTPDANWSQIAYLFQAGGPFFAPVILRLLPEYTDDALKARLLNACLFFPAPAFRGQIMSFLPTTAPADSVGTLSLVNTLQHFDAPEARSFRERFLTYAAHARPESIVAAGLQHRGRRVVNAAWRALSEQEYTNQSMVAYLLDHPGVPVEELVEACSGRPDWLELLGRFRRQFLDKGYRGDLVPVLDEFVVSNTDRYKWPTGERHHKRIEPEIQHALYQQTLSNKTFELLHERLHDKDGFRRENAAMHLAAYCQFPRILSRRTASGEMVNYFAESPATRSVIPAKTVAKLVESTLSDQRIRRYNFAAQAVAQLTLDGAHGEGVTDYLISRARQHRSDQDFVFCCYLLLAKAPLNPRKKDIVTMLPRAIPLIPPADRAGFGRLLLQLHVPELSHQFLELVAPSQSGQTYAMFEELAQSVNLLHDQQHGLPLAIFHPEYSQEGAAAGAEKKTKEQGDNPGGG